MSSRRRQTRQSKATQKSGKNEIVQSNIEDAAENKEEPMKIAGDDGMAEYERVRQENIRRNQEFMQSLGLDTVKSELDELKPQKSPASKRVVSTKRSHTPTEPVRRSTRHKGGIDGETFVDTLEQYRQAAEAAAMEKWTRLPPDPISMQVPVETDAEESEEVVNEEVTTLPAVVGDIIRNECAHISPPKASTYMQQMLKLQLTEEGVAKVVKERGQSIAFHPGADKLIVVAGDKSGQLGIWNVDGQDTPNDGVTTYQVHRSSIIHLEFLPSDHRKLLTMGYDSVFRLGDMEAEAFVELYRAPEDMDDLYYSFCCLSPESDDLVYISRSDGRLSVLDLRATPRELRTSAELHDRKINTVQVSPTDPNLLVTASLDHSIKLWDARMFGTKKMKPTHTIVAHSKSINCAFISPDGTRMISVGLDDTIKLFDQYQTSSNATHTIRHDNQTGRWLTKFKPAWDPKQPDMFFMGSMERPRRAELFRASNGRLEVAHRFTGSADFPVSAVLSLHAVHPTRFSFAGINSSGRVTIFR